MPLSPSLTQSIISAVAENFPAELAFIQEVIQYGGQRGDESTVQEELFQQYTSRGYATTKLSMDTDALSKQYGAGKVTTKHSTAPVVVGVLEPKSPPKGKSLILNGHIDVVPTGPEELWTHSPYSGVVEGDWLYGRGGADMRAGNVANMFALDALRAIGKRPASKVIIESVPEEESTGNGTMTTHLAGYTADAVLIPEPTNEQLVRANVGVIWFQIAVTGRPVHVLKATEGSNAIESIWNIVGGLKELEKEMNVQKKGRLHFEDLPHPINLNVAMIEGGDWASSVPAWCKIDCRVALFPGVRAEDVAAQIEHTVSSISATDAFLKDAPPKITWNGFFAEGYVLEPGSDAEETLKAAHKHVSGNELESCTMPAYLDTRIFSLFQKIPALCYGPVGESLHGFDERVSVSSVQRVTAAIALFIAEWCGLEDIEEAG
ncbi:acetylornithine deacetylase [Bimuria novae-zelandiae CBS 107.79]|uniref:Acetylornithine deacetylase n=1 Tax=Bimuria novae-zelandiae CBS 107.79 TaxID=1447943 RepID=A0A6A5VF65_9PLEO|nr:acetylornithine deacetylase [Bimuria novae-zelandiae CBS 107.79]